jgi:hypothetical protein
VEESTATNGSAAVQGPDDPFAEVPSDALGDGGVLPPGVQPGSLGGDNPSQEAAVQQEEAAAGEAEEPPVPLEDEAAPDPLAEEPMGGEFMEEPPEPDDLAPPVEEPVAEEPPTPEPPAAETPQAEPPTPVPSSPEPEGAATPAPPAPAAPPIEEEPPPIEGPAVPSAPEEGGGPPAPEPEPEAKPEAKKRKRKPRKKKAEKGQRGYVILKLDTDRLKAVVGGSECPSWVEAFEREVPVGEEGSEPVTIDSRGGEMALRMAYRRLSENGEGTYTLVAVPAKLFKPKKVEGKVPENALTIKVN